MTTVLILGRAGDIIQILPALHAISKRDGKPVRVITSTEYKEVFDGVSYVHAASVRSKWDEGIPGLRDNARARFGSCLIPQFWLEFDRRPEAIPHGASPAPFLNCKGVQWPVDLVVDPDYGTAMWRRLGFTREDMMRFPLVFDQRDFERERWLGIRYTKVKKPLLLVHFHGVSSPFAPHPEIMSVVNQFGADFNIVDLGKIWFHRIYDVLGLMEIATGMILCDSAFLHLAPATTTPYLAYTQNGWSGSKPKGNCMVQVSYANALTKRDELVEFMEFASDKEAQPA